MASADSVLNCARVKLIGNQPGIVPDACVLGRLLGIGLQVKLNALIFRNVIGLVQVPDGSTIILV